MLRIVFLLALFALTFTAFGQRTATPPQPHCAVTECQGAKATTAATSPAPIRATQVAESTARPSCQSRTAQTTTEGTLPARLTTFVNQPTSAVHNQANCQPQDCAPKACQPAACQSRSSTSSSRSTALASKQE